MFSGERILVMSLCGKYLRVFEALPARLGTKGVYCWRAWIIHLIWAGGTLRESPDDMVRSPRR